MGGVFPSKEAFNKVYDECLENEPQAPESLQNAYKELSRAFNNYLAEYNECTFRYAYECGYEAAKKGGAAV